MSEDTQKSKRAQPDMDKFMSEARDRFKQAQDDERDIRDEALKDLQFLSGEQWDIKLKTDRENSGRPALTDNRLPTFVQQVSNEARQNKPQIKFSPKKEGSKDTAEVLEGLARNIQYDSDSEVAYETALEYAAGGSFGYFGFLTDYEDDDNDDQCIEVRCFYDPFAVYGVLIPSCFGREPKFAFVTDWMDKAEYEAEYGTSKIGEFDWEAAAEKSGDWMEDGKIRIAEYWYVEETKAKKGKREVKQPKVKFCKINGSEILPGSETEWLGYCIPIFPVLGKQIITRGKPSVFSLIRNMRTSQQLLNFTQTRIAETLATAPISPFIGAEGQFAGHEKEWATINSVLRPYVEYKTVDTAGKPTGPPQRQTFEPPIQSLAEFRAMLIDDQKSQSGIFDASLGKQSNEKSGIAIQQRQQQSSTTNMHFLDNLERAYKKGGKVLGDLIPLVYDAERMVRILGEDEASKIVKINAPHTDDKGNSYHHKLEPNQYDVAVTMGKSWSTKRMETFDTIANVLGGKPEMISMVGDILFANSDLAGADLLAKRFKKMLPPQLVDDDEQAPVPPAAQAKMAQLTQQLQAMHAYAQQVEQEAQKLQMEQKAKVIEQQGRMAIEQLHAETQVTVAEITTKAQNERERLKLEFDLNSKLNVSAHEAGMQAADQAHQAGMQAQQQSADQQAQAADQTHEVGMADMGHQQTLEQQDQAGQQAMAQQAAQQQASASQE